ncbi:MAG: Hpt domain-containing protein [Clostridia bacterium]|nr:Hpt domain-containing protein [Clostridia bacterium]NLS86301.1 Hpt domain-containing protein [Oscillospiraceae bacterium]
MNRYKLTKAGVDVNDGIRRLGGNREVYERLLFMFPDDPSYNRMLLAIENGDAEESFAAAHAQKGVAGNLSLVDLHSAILPLVEIFRAGTMENHEQYLPEVKRCYEAAAKEILAEREG